MSPSTWVVYLLVLVVKAIWEGFKNKFELIAASEGIINRKLAYFFFMTVHDSV